MIGGIEETSASYEARSAPRSYPAGGRATASGDPVGWETERCRMAQATAPILDSTSTDMLLQSSHVCCWGQSGPHLLEGSISPFDPYRTSTESRASFHFHQELVRPATNAT